jgi:ubiquinone/menaquinone biosynthesis C-methylase UbiE
MLRPGAFTITDKGLELCNLKKGDKVLEIGCGEGETTERLEKHYGFDVSAVDTSLEMVRLTKDRQLKANILLGDGEFLDDFVSRSMDGVVMECVLSLINLPDEALHEVFCLLKEGGKLFISDLYIKNPDPALLRAVDIEASRQNKISHASASCSDECAEDHKKRIVNFRHKGVLLLEPLKEAMKEMGFQIVAWEDFSLELDAYIAESILSEKEPILHATMPKNTGYFMLVAEKKR